jgi:hypothetical protein
MLWLAPRPTEKVFMTNITSSLIKAGCSNAGGWNKKQLRVLGRRISDRKAELFIALKGITIKKGDPSK